MIEFSVNPENGDAYEVTATSRDVLLWEKTTKGRSVKTLMDDVSLVDMYKIAYLASQRQGLFHGTIKEFEDSVDLDFEETDQPDPTQPGASTGQ